MNTRLVAAVQRHHPVARATLDVDASIHACDKKAALRTYEGERGYQPVGAYWVEQGLVVADRFRDGNVPAGMGNAEFVRQVRAALPPEVRERQGDHFDGPARREYAAVVTNRTGPGDRLIHWHREKCGTIEHVHDWIKHDVGGRYFPSSAFGANAAWYRLAVLALDLYQALKTSALPEARREERLGTARFRWLSRAGRVVRHARRYVVVLSALAAEALATCVGARAALAETASG